MLPRDRLDILRKTAPWDAAAVAWVSQRVTRPGWVPVWSGEEQMSADEVRTAKAAAVLIPLINRPSGVTLLLTRRTAALRDHAGQISFPGGRVAPEDADPVQTALRETREEIGVGAGQVRILGVMPDYFIPTGYRVVPVVGWLEPPVEVSPDPSEVAEVFEFPLAVAFDPGRHHMASAWRGGRLRRFYAMPWEGRDIWGATAGMLVNLYHALRDGD